jgi:hypothetical protein
MGGPDEATEYVTQCGPAWHRTPGAVAWLTNQDRRQLAAEAAGTPGCSLNGV